MGIFETFMQNLSARAKTESAKNGQTTANSIPFWQRGLAGLTAGGLAALLGNPADMTLIRMQTDKLLPLEKRANYTGVFNALRRISATEGVLSLWNGCLPTVTRAMALNFGQLAFFSESKMQLQKSGLIQGPLAVSLTASAIAGFFASFFSLPFDFIKTRLQQQKPKADGSLKYKGSIDCVRQVIKEEGVGRFYRGFSTYYVRIAPHAMVTLLVADYLGFLTR